MGYALITGASKGIGYELALEAARRSKDLILVARSSELLRLLQAEITNKYPVKVLTFKADLSNSKDIKRLFDFCNKKRLQVDWLINNAGYGSTAKFSLHDYSFYENMVQLNILSVIQLISLFEPQLMYILNVASLGGFQPLPYKAVYAASKSFLVSFSLSLNFEYKEKNIVVATLCPGGVATNELNKASIGQLGLIARQSILGADKVAQIGIAGMLRKKKIIIPGKLNKISFFLMKWVPLAIRMKSLAKVYRQ